MAEELKNILFSRGYNVPQHIVQQIIDRFAPSELDEDFVAIAESLVMDYRIDNSTSIPQEKQDLKIKVLQQAEAEAGEVVSLIMRIPEIQRKYVEEQLTARKIQRPIDPEYMSFQKLLLENANIQIADRNYNGIVFIGILVVGLFLALSFAIGVRENDYRNTIKNINQSKQSQVKYQ